MRSKIYILLHGAWHANWCWKYITPNLEARGHKVFAPNLPGHGADKTPFKEISLKSYLDHTSKLIKSLDTQVILVGHSMSGSVISALAEEIPGNIEKLIYISAFVPDNNGSLVQEEEKARIPGVTKEIIIDAENNEISLKLSPIIRKLFFNKCSEEEAYWALSQLQKQPFKPFIDKVNLTQKRFGQVPKLYIECLEDNAIRIEDQRRMSAKLNCEVITLDSDHSPFLSNPQTLTETLHKYSSAQYLK